MSIPHRRNQIVVDQEKLTSTYNDSGISFVYDINNNNSNCKSTIHDLDLAQGLIDLLVEHNFAIESLLTASSSELSKLLV